MEFEVIQHEQTPKTPPIDDVLGFIELYKKELDAFKKYAEDTKTCIGLAANQCTLNKERFNVRVVAIKDIKTRECLIAVNPKITKYYGVKRQKAEGCLTWGQNNNGYWCIIADRYHSVDVEYYSMDGELKKETHKGFQSQVWQHELNHINGVEEYATNNSFILDEPIDKKTQRNELCPCKSGLKYKKCCIDD